MHRLDCQTASFTVSSPCRRLFFMGLLSVAFAGAVPDATFGQAPDDQPARTGEHWAVLVGIEQYERANPLQFTINDVRLLGETLRERGGYEAGHILQITDDALDLNHRPLKRNLMSELAAWLKRPAEGDTIIVYFSGHGFRASDGSMYLAPIYVDPADPAASGIPLAWLREQIAGCRAELKLLVLDACHAGSEKGDGGANLDARDLNLFEGLEKVVTLASSTASEKSQIWAEKEQSLYSYWLVEGLKGHADNDGDGAVDIDELYQYVHRTVAHTAKVRFERAQTPVRKVGLVTPGAPVVLRLKPRRLKQLLIDMGQQLADSIDERKIDKVGVVEFTNDTKVGELLGAEYGLLGKQCSEELERQLLQQASGRFSVVDQRRLRAAIEQQHFALADLGSGEALKALAEKAGGMPVIAVGTLSGRTGRMVTLRCKLLRTDKNEVLATVGGAAWLNEREWGMLGLSAKTRPEDHRPAPAFDDEPAKPSVADQVVDHLDQRAQGPHPLSDPKFPYRVWLEINGRERKGVFKGNDYFVPVRKGEVYEIKVRIDTHQTVMMQLLVDGRNTLPEKEGDKGLATEIIAKRVNLAVARPWVLDPIKKSSNVFAIRGFVTKTGADGKYRVFTVANADDTLGERTRFDEELGMITAAFYAPVPGTRGGMMTDLGDERDGEVAEVKGACGNLLAVVHIRYVDANALPKGR